MLSRRSAAPPARLPHPVPADPNRHDANVRDEIRILGETIVHLNERVELLEAREQLRRPR